jgi:hypothetical protein
MLNSGLQPGEHVLTVEATDTAGNVGSASHTWTIAPPRRPRSSTSASWAADERRQDGRRRQRVPAYPGGASVDDGVFAVDTDSGTGTSTNCTSSSKDRHRFRDYGIALPAAALIKSTEVRLDAKVDSTSDSPELCVQLSWNGGASWTSAKTTSTLSRSESSRTLGGPTNT